ncbi:telomere-associated protein RIF1 [Aricia agestis]|uniref:telomere-associated protein RIF1 n=1 Tax=Aricia agestis TaxID=91739 RepID=UPI001C208D41|nr:telomere-associated protein RIF1 [Aricia agestis]XP_041977043.1 telomere-associated protein RIF1 [Aricia agestis]
MSGEIAAGLEEVLDQLADYTLNTHNFQSIHNALNTEKSVKTSAIDKLLSICIRALKEDRKYTVNTLNIVLSIIKKVNDGQCTPVPDLVPSALAVLHLLQTTVLFTKVEVLKILCFEILLSYPEEILVSIAVNQGTEFMELFNSYCHQRIPVDIRLQPVNLLGKLLKILPPDRRRQFVKHGVSVWFSKIVPTVVLYVNSANANADYKPVEALEMLTEELVHIDYVDNPQWQIVLECIYTPQRYPSIMKSLLEKDNVVWCHLWVIFIKLLKTQITKVSNTVKGSPINSMLPVVELAFKMNPQNRCRAFECWNVLIDNFSTETSDLYINKRIKLLIIPLVSNNAKVVETAAAKLNTWWHLIIKFTGKLQNVADLALIPFLYFCFGKPNTDKPMLIPGLLSEELKMKCIEAITEIFGHTSDCDCRIDLPRLNDKLVTGNLLVSHWKEWIHAVDNTIKLFVATNSKQIESYVKCIWCSLLSTISDLTENKLKKDLYYEVLSYLDKLCLGVTNAMGKVILETFIPSLFNQKGLVTSKIRIDECPLEQKVISMLLRLPRDVLIVRPEYVNELKNVTDLFLEEKSPLTLNTIELVIKEVPTKGLLVWTALAQSMCKTKYNANSKALSQMLLCPLEKSTLNVTSFSSWLDLYSHVLDQNSAINDNILNIISNNDKLDYCFAMTISLEMVKQKIKSTDGKGTSYNKELENLRKLSASKDLTVWFCDKGNFEAIIEVVINVFTKLNPTNDTDIENVIGIATNILGQPLQQILEESRICDDLENLFKIIEMVVNKDKHTKSKLQIINEIKVVGAKFLDKLEPYHNKEVIKKLKTLLDSIYSNGKTVTDNITSFVEPEKKVAMKKSKKKEATIVNTVTDQGEEYVVVKSNWKFNPKKLTDNQKEKFKRKREDIPALYQDLSQSQDEFKLMAWKTDSQDTSSTSKSTTVSMNEDVSSILKNFPNSEIVPKILENMKPTSENNISNHTDDVGLVHTRNNTVELKLKKDLITTPTPRETKSPRMALKDRVFRNVKNLIEKSNIPNANISLNSNLIESDPKTPVSKKPDNMTGIVNSAPPKISTERPNRQKRKPKKFEDVELFGMKKRRQSLGQNDYPSQTDTGDEKDERNADNKNENISSEKPVGVEGVNDNKIVQESENLHSISVTIEPSLNTGSEIQDNISIESKPDGIKDKPETADKQQNTAENMEIVSETDKAGPSTENEKKNTSLDDFKTEVPTPKLKNREQKVSESTKSSTKKTCSKKSRIEKELAIDMVEGHPLLNSPAEARVTRKRLLNTPSSRRSKSESTPNNKLETRELKSKSEGKIKEKPKENFPLQREDTLSSDDTPSSQDIIESSQDSSITTISVKSTISSKKTPTVVNNKLNVDTTETQHLIKDHSIDELQFADCNKDKLENTNVTFNVDGKNKDDTELPRNKTAVDDSTFIDLTENMDTEPISQIKTLDDVVVIEDDQPEVVEVINTEVGPETQEIAEADTQSMDPCAAVEPENPENIPEHITDNTANNVTETIDNVLDVTSDITQSIEDVENKRKPKFSPFKDEEQRKKDFLNNTIEISPIKTLSPIGEAKTSAQDTSGDFVVIKLKSPVQCNGEPFDKCDSPEIFTEEQKISPDKRNMSPPREEITVTNTSPSSSLSLKKRPQVRSGGRGAQMLGLCVPNRLQTSDKTDVEEKKSTPINTSARRNLRIMYNATTENNDTTEEEDNDNFLKLKRSLPSTDCSPAGPILKRKLSEITDDATVSPASKRKRVSFHDPPVSTTICVKKYIEPCGIRSPQNSAIKRQERQLRSQVATKSPKRLDNLFKLDTVLTKAVESFVEENTSTNEDTEMSLDPTPVVEIVKTSELNDTDPICLELIDCEDSIEKIAAELSSNTMKTLLVKEFEGKINTVGDLAKLTELEVNRLCIKAPKVEVAKKVLSEYASMIKQASEEITPTVEEAMSESMVPEFMAMEVQTDEVLFDNVAMQTDVLETSEKHVQSDPLSVSHNSAQTDESGTKSTEDLVKSCLERDDFTTHLCDHTDNNFKKDIAEKLPANSLTDLVLKKMTSTNSTEVVNGILDHRLSTNSKEENLSLLREFICDKFESKDLILFCSEILKNAHSKIT